MGTLKSLGYVGHNTKTKKYCLTYQLVRVSFCLSKRIRIPEITPYMKKLAQEFKEMVNLAVLEQDKVLYLHSIDCPHALKLDLKVGSYPLVHRTALGRVLLAYQDEGTIASSLKKNKLTAYTAKTITNPAQLRNILEQIREEGYSFVSEEYRPGVCCIAVPIFNDLDTVVASLSFSLPTARMAPETLTTMIKSLKNYVNKANLPHIFKYK